MQALLSVCSLNKSFGAMQAISDVSFSVYEGEIFGIAGPNGSGKSTLFNIITKIPFAPDSGAVALAGDVISGQTPHAIARAGIARTFQKETSFDTLSVYDNVRVGAAYGRGKFSINAISAALREVGLSEYEWARPASELSVFDKKRLMIASSMVMKPRLLLLDEPASGLTKPEIEQMIGLLQRINQSGVTILVIEHVLPLLLTLSQRLLVLDRGHVLTLGDPDEVLRHPEVIEAYLGSATQKHVHA